MGLKNAKLLLVTALVELTHHSGSLSGAWIAPEKPKGTEPVGVGVGGAGRRELGDTLPPPTNSPASWKQNPSGLLPTETLVNWIHVPSRMILSRQLLLTIPL